MKMEAADKVEELIGPEVPPKLLEKQEAALGEEGPIELEMPGQKEGEAVSEDSTVLASMPCLLMELRRDSSESQLASTESDKPAAGRVYESDSSNHCMLSPSSSGHLADSDTLSSAEENQPSQAEATAEGEASAVSGSTVGRKSRRSRSESETSTMAAKKNRQSSDKQNGRVTKAKGHRSQKHKERIRLLRQKREAAARKKYNLLQDSSTSDSDLTCDSSTSSSDDDEEVSGSSKTITAEIPGSISMPAREQTSPQRRMAAERRRVRRLGVLADFARAVVEQGEMEAMERRRLEEKRDREVAAFMQRRAEENSELSSLRLALDRGNDIMQSLLTVLLQRLGSSGGPGGAGAWGGSVSEEASCSRRTSAVPGYRSAPATTSPAAEHCADADISFPILAEDTKLGSCVGATAPLPSEIEQLMMVGEASMLCGTQDECPNAQLLDMPPGGGGSDAVAAGKAFSVVLMDNQEPSASCMSVTENKSARGIRRGSVLEPKRVRKATARMNL